MSIIRGQAAGGEALRWRLPLALLALGLVATVVGFGYDLAFAGIPYQDPTPEMAAGFHVHSGIASVIEVGGLVLISLGLLVSAAVGARSLSRHGAAQPRFAAEPARRGDS